jgi:anti-sigma factor RsiW
MVDEELEFAISQYVDGALPPAQAAALEVRLSFDAEAAAVLQEFRKLNGLVALPLPPIQWDRLSVHLSESVAEHDAESRTFRVYAMPWVRRVASLAVAACLAVVIGVGYQHRTHPASPGAARSEAMHGELAVAGPSADVPAGAVVEQISVGPSPSVAMDDSTWRYGDSGVVSQPQRVVIATSDAPVQDTSATPY